MDAGMCYHNLCKAVHKAVCPYMCSRKIYNYDMIVATCSSWYISIWIFPYLLLRQTICLVRNNPPWNSIRVDLRHEKTSAISICDSDGTLMRVMYQIRWERQSVLFGTNYFKTPPMPIYRSSYRCITMKACIQLLSQLVCNENLPVPSRKKSNLFHSMVKELYWNIWSISVLLFHLFNIFRLPYFSLSNKILLQQCAFIVPILYRGDRGFSQLYISYAYSHK